MRAKETSPLLLMRSEVSMLALFFWGIQLCTACGGEDERRHATEQTNALPPDENLCAICAICAVCAVVFSTSHYYFHLCLSPSFRIHHLHVILNLINLYSTVLHTRFETQ